MKFRFILVDNYECKVYVYGTNSEEVAKNFNDSEYLNTTVIDLEKDDVEELPTNYL